MNKKQLIVAWIAGILICYICGFTIIGMFINSKTSPDVHYSGWQPFMLLLLPLLIIGSLLIYTLRLRRKGIAKETNGKKITLQQVIVVLGIVLAGFTVIYFKPKGGIVPLLVMLVFYLTIVSYPIYLFLVFTQWFAKSRKKKYSR